jgi:ATP-dependent 26S proteasome regulatory subunit
MAGDDTIRTLREAIGISPENMPLRQHLAATLMSLCRYEEAEQELRAALALAPDNRDLKAELARAYYQQEKLSQALVIVEALVEKREASPATLVLYARILLRRGDVQNAVAQYKLALEQDPQVRDDDLSQRLGVGGEPRGEIFEGRARAAAADFSEAAPAEIERPKLTFADVGGMEPLKEEIGMKIIYPLKHPEMYRAYGKAIGGGVLMYGPPGCGKTYLARATAGEIQAGFMAVGINDVLEMWIGNSERNLHAMFEQARDNRPCVIFFDEVDALGARRSDMHGGAQRQLINQFLSEMDGVTSSNDGLLILAATNAPWHLDPAFRRPGRFDRVLFVRPPDAAARAQIMRLHCRGKPAETLDFEQIARKTEHFSGADLKAVVDLTIEAKLREAMRSGVPQPITTKDLLAAAKSIKPTTREWFSTARNYALYANQGGLYDDVLRYLNL